MPMDALPSDCQAEISTSLESITSLYGRTKSLTAKGNEDGVDMKLCHQLFTEPLSHSKITSLFSNAHCSSMAVDFHSHYFISTHLHPG